MDKKNHIINILLPVILLVYGIISFYPLLNWWGISHFYFMPFGFSAIFWVILAALFIMLFTPVSERGLDNITEKTDSFIWGRTRFVWIIISIIFMGIFYLFRLDTYFLGDGYTCLAILGKGEGYIHKWTEPGSLYLLRWLQSLFGGYTRTTALYSFQVVSFISGGVVIYNILSLCGFIFQTPKSRILSLATLLFSGHLILYFGYIEFYAMSWAATILLVNSSVRFLKKKGSLLVVYLLYLIALAVHLQALYLLPGIAYLTVQKFEKPIIKKIGYVIMALAAFTGIVIMVWLYRTRIEFEILLLPILNARPQAPGYTVLSTRHIFDLFNLVMLVFPGLLLLLLYWIINNRKILTDKVGNFLIFMSLGSMAFLVMYGAAITMAFDWDIMSLTLLCPALLILYNITDKKVELKGKTIIYYLIICVFVTGAFLAVNISTKSSEDRYHTLLNDRHRSSWIVYADYFKNKNDNNRYREIFREASEKFPRYRLLNQAYGLLQEKKYDRAAAIAKQLSTEDPYNADFAQLMGNMMGKSRKYDSAVIYYQKAMKLKPYNTGILNELGQIYINSGNHEKARDVLKKAHWHSPGETSITESLALNYIYMKHLDSALALADSLFIDQSDSPGGHLIRLVTALNRGDQQTAALHYRMFLKAGVGRSDYESIKEYYKYLLE